MPADLLILLWCCAWLILMGLRAVTNKEVTLGDVWHSLLFGPMFIILFIFAFPFLVIYELWNKPLWSKRDG